MNILGDNVKIGLFLGSFLYILGFFSMSRYKIGRLDHLFIYLFIYLFFFLGGGGGGV